MNELERAISERQDTIRRLEKEIDQAKSVLLDAQKELSFLLAARQIVSKEKFVHQFSPIAAQMSITGLEAPLTTQPLPTTLTALLTVPTPVSLHSDGGSTYELTPKRAGPYPSVREMTLVNEVRATLEHSASPLGPSEIRSELAKHGREVPQNVMTGVLSRLNKEGRVKRLERGKYIAVTEAA
jgi:hypothetical protein